MKNVYQVTIRGRKLESHDLRQLLARAVREKRNLDQKLRVNSRSSRAADCSWSCCSAEPVVLALQAVQ